MRGKLRACSAVFLGMALLGLVVNSGVAAVGYGIKGGLTLGNVKSMPEQFIEGYPWKTYPGLAGGVFVNLGVTRGFSIQPEVLYVQKNTRITIPEHDAEATWHFDYIEIPLLLKYSLGGEGSKIVPAVNAGPFLGFNSKAKMVTRLGQNEETEDIKEDIRSSEYGIAFGAGLATKLGSVKLGLDVRYDLGISDIMKEGVEGPEYVKTRVWLIMLELSF